MIRKPQATSLTPRAFTLIELLVVVTIIVVLLALLTPALDRAIYQAELVVCASSKRVVAGAVMDYASANRRWYPPRRVEDPGVSRSPQTILGEGLDDRDYVRPYMALNKVFNDPLARAVELETPQPGTIVVAPIALWYGWRYKSAYASDRGMMKLGDRFEWSDPFYSKVMRRFSAIASDAEQITENAESGVGTHPERNGTWYNDVMQEVTAVTLTTDTKATFSRWGYYPAARGLTEMNVAFADGSTELFRDVRWDEPDHSTRMARVPTRSNYNEANDGGFWINLPPE